MPAAVSLGGRRVAALSNLRPFVQAGLPTHSPPVPTVQFTLRRFALAQRAHNGGARAKISEPKILLRLRRLHFFQQLPKHHCQPQVAHAQSKHWWQNSRGFFAQFN